MFRYRGHLYREAADPQRDRQYRQQAQQAYQNLIEAMKRPATFYWPGQGFAVSGSYLGDYADLVVFFSDEGGARGTFAPLKKPHRVFRYAIVLNVIPDEWALKDEAEQVEMLPHLYFEREFIHEFIHYLDRKRRQSPISERGKQRRQQQDLSTPEGLQQYLSNPEEFNAWFQQQAHQIEKELRSFGPKARDLLQKFWLRDFHTFRDRALKAMEDDGWVVQRLDARYRRKLLKRLYGLWQQLAEEYR